jgi:predicted lipid-binding transport protein (Tim44 family)
VSEGTPGPTGPFEPVVIDWDQFGALARAAFFTVKRALANQRPDICRHVMTEDAWQHLRAQVDVLRLDGCSNVQSGLDVTQVRQGDHDVYGSLDRVTVGLLISGVDYVVNQATGQVVCGQKEHSDWLETWTLERSRDPQLVAAGQAPKCPNCGAPLSISSDGLCAFCQAVVPGAKTDWLVAGIGRPSEVPVDQAIEHQADMEAGQVVMSAMAAQNAEHPWTGSDPAKPSLAGDAGEGIAAIQKRDPSFNASDLVVEAREVFLELEEARNQLHPGEVRAMVGDALYAREVDRARRIAASGRNEVRAYLDIRQVTLTSAGTDGRRDWLVARVDAVSARSVIDLHTGNLAEGSLVTHPWAEELVFERSAGAVTNPLSGLLAHRCPACGQPSGVSEDGLCVHCGQHVTGGERDWILIEVRPLTVAAGGPPA